MFSCGMRNKNSAALVMIQSRALVESLPVGGRPTLEGRHERGTATNHCREDRLNGSYTRTFGFRVRSVSVQDCEEERKQIASRSARLRWRSQTGEATAQDLQ